MISPSPIQTDITLKRDFTSSASKLVKRKKKRKGPPPVSIRFTQEQRGKLEEMAAGVALSTYIKAVLFDDGKTPRKSRNSNPIKDYQKLAMALGMLGKLDTLTKLTDFMDAVEQERMNVPANVQQEVMHACADIRLIRCYLITALGIKAED